MIQALVWKEWREQRTIALAVLAFGVLALFLTAQFAPATSGGPSVVSRLGARELMAPALAYLAGAVCGAMLLADEKEAGTIEFLDALPCLRRQVWVGKAVFGVGLTLIQSVLLAALAIGFGCVDSSPAMIRGYALFVVLVGLQSLAWGVCGGATARSTLGAVFQGSLCAIAAGVVLAVPFVAVFGPRELSRPYGTAIMGFYTAWLTVGLGASAVIFSQLDRRPLPLVATGARARSQRSRRLPGFGAVFWLTARQAVWITIGAAAGGLAIGGVMVAPDAYPLFIWPAATLGLGVLAGVTIMGEEQTRGVALFWAERRLPLGRLWLTKVTAHFAIAVGASVLMFLPLLIADSSRPFRTRLLGEVRPEIMRFLGLGLVYGFAVGHLAGLMFRKTIVAGLAATVSAAAAAGLILPSLLGGGVTWWQVWAPAFILVATGRLLLYPWATERVAARGPVLRAVSGCGAAAVVLAGGLAYRVLEVPDTPDRLTASGFIESLPSYDANEAGRIARAAASQYRRAATDAGPVFRGRLQPVPMAQTGGRATPEWSEALNRAAQSGWGPESATLKPWLDRVFADDWHRQLNDLAEKPVGMFDDPRDLDYANRQDATRDLREMVAALRTRGLQRQAEGDPEAFPRLMRGGLAAARTARHKGGVYTADLAFQSEDLMLTGLGEWLAHYEGGPEPLRRVLADLERHEHDMPMGADDSFWAEQIILRNTMDRVASWLPAYLTLMPVQFGTSSPQADSEAELVAFCWGVPWERVRRERILRVNTHPDRRVESRWLSGLHYPQLWRTDRAPMVASRDLRGLALRRLARVQVALRLFQTKYGRPAAALAELVPTYLRGLPADPFTGAAFGYRVSGDETLEMSQVDLAAELRTRTAGGAVAAIAYPLGGLNGGWLVDELIRAQFATRASFRARSSIDAPIIDAPQSVGQVRIAPGSGILWSAGPDGRDDGGRRAGPFGGPTGPGEDWIIIVPPVRP